MRSVRHGAEPRTQNHNATKNLWRLKLTKGWSRFPNNFFQDVVQGLIAELASQEGHLGSRAQDQQQERQQVTSSSYQ